jgi:hypothetical protein
MLQQLSPQSVELAFKYLSQPIQEPPPPELSNLNEMEWFLLGRMLESLLKEKSLSQVQ